ncbi:MAG: hypothetical protein DBX41_01220 [Clostridiales bacterium]|nr:MAG: hypothetical protein DBX41_01220 [Clostridiales bacterium]
MPKIFGKYEFIINISILLSPFPAAKTIFSVFFCKHAHKNNRGGLMRSSEEKLWAMSGYILFFLPLLKPKNEFLRFHANQGLVLWLSYLFLSFIVKYQPFIGVLLLFLAKIGYFTGVLFGIYQAYLGKETPLPFIGSIKILR